MELPPLLSKDARAVWHKRVEGFREPIALTATSQAGFQLSHPHAAEPGCRHRAGHRGFMASSEELQGSADLLHGAQHLSSCAWLEEQNMPQRSAAKLSLRGAVRGSAACGHVQGVGSARHLQILPRSGPEGAPGGKGRGVSEQAKELWTWCQVRTLLQYCTPGPTHMLMAAWQASQWTPLKAENL